MNTQGLQQPCGGAALASQLPPAAPDLGGGPGGEGLSDGSSQGPERTHKHENPTNSMISGIPPYIGPLNQNVRSLCTDFGSRLKARLKRRSTLDL